jgi:hypothetical protein
VIPVLEHTLLPTVLLYSVHVHSTEYQLLANVPTADVSASLRASAALTKLLVHCGGHHHVPLTAFAEPQQDHAEQNVAVAQVHLNGHPQ